MSLERSLQRLREIGSDRTRGARELALEASRALHMEVRAALSTGEAYDAEELARAVVSAQPEMATFHHLAAAIVSAGRNLGELEARLAAFARKLEDESAAQHAASRIPDGSAILTYSRSGSVLSALQIAHRSGKSFRVLLGEGRPRYEGRSAAKDLAKAGIAVELLTDAALFGRLGEAELILVGADAVGRQHFLNKVGTRALTALARLLDRRVWVLLDETKLFPEHSWRASEERSATEVWSDAPHGVHVGNPYFEAIPLTEVDGFLMGDAILTAQEVASRVDRAAAILEPLRRIL